MMGHSLWADGNREILLEVGLPQDIISLLEAYAESVNPVSTEPLPLSTPDLQIVKTAIGVLLNVSVGYGAPSCRCFHSTLLY